MPPSRLELGLAAASVRWSVRARQPEMFRRTGEPRDRVTAQSTPERLANHCRGTSSRALPELQGGRTVPWVPLNSSARTPRFRDPFSVHARGGTGIRTSAGGVIAARSGDLQRGPGPGTTHSTRGPELVPTPRARCSTAPGGIYAQSHGVGQDLLNLGFLDDSCDGIVTVTIDVGGRAVRRFARIWSGPPAFAPDSLPVRRLPTRWSRWLLGDEVASTTADDVISICAPGGRTMRLMNSARPRTAVPVLGSWRAGIVWSERYAVLAHARAASGVPAQRGRPASRAWIAGATSCGWRPARDCERSSRTGEGLGLQRAGRRRRAAGDAADAGTDARQ